MLLLWIPLRQWPGLGTIANVFVIGIATDVMLSVVETPDALWLRVTMLLGGIVVNGLGERSTSAASTARVPATGS